MFEERGAREARTLPAIAALAAALAAAWTQLPLLAEGPPAPLTLPQALRAAAERSQAAVAAGLDTAGAREATARAKAAYLPSFNVSAGWFGRDHEVVAVFDTSLGHLSAETTQKNFFVGELSATQLLWDGGRRSATVRASRSGETAAAEGGRAGVVSSQVEALSSYVRILVLKAQRRVVDQRVTSLEGHLREAKDLYEQGVVARNDLLATEVRLRTVKDQVPQLENGVAVASASLNRLMGKEPAAPLLLPESLPAPPPLPEAVADLHRRLPERNPVLKALRAREDAESRIAELRRKEELPTLFAKASHEYQQNQYLAYPHSNVLFFGLNWSVFDGGRGAVQRQADLAAEKTRRESEDARRGLEIELERSGRDYEQALREAATARSNTAAAEENLRIVEDQYKAGIARSTDVLDAEAILAESRFATANQHYTAYLRQGALLGAAGLDLAVFYGEPAAPAAAAAPRE